MTKKEILNTPEIVDFMIDKSVMVDSKMKLHKRLDELCKLAIKALEQEPCEDCISRQAVKSILGDRYIELQKRHDDKRLETNYCLNTILELPSINPQKIGHCKDCKYFEYDSLAKVDGVKLIFAHEICKRWGDGCKTSEEGFCFLFEPQESEE